MFTLYVPGPDAKAIVVSPEHPVFLLGRNGTGKSALMHFFRQQLGGSSVYLPGNRTSVFDAEGLNMTPSARTQYGINLLGWDNDSSSRWRLISGNQRNDKAVHDLTSAEVQYTIDINRTIKGGDVDIGVAKLLSNTSPIDKINNLLEQANIGVRFSIEKGEIKANKDGNIYSFARMSDGERIALVLISEIISAEPGVVLIIDEPELHLHRAIVIPLMKSLIAMRKDCSFIVSTHELELPSEVKGAKVCIVRSATWDQYANVTSWDIDLVEVSAIPDDLRTDLLGSRRKILFIEGGFSSLDKPLYAVLFPKVSTIPRDGCREVARAVVGLRTTAELHRAEAYGLIDGDGMSTSQAEEYKSQGVFALSVYAVESLYYAPELQLAVAQRQAETHKSELEEQQALGSQYVNDAKSRALAALNLQGKLEHLASRVAERQLRDLVIASIPSRDQMVSGTSADITLTLPSPYTAELAKIKALAAANDLDSIVARYPVRETGALDAIAKALRFPGRSDYESAALARLSSDKDLQKKLRDKLSPLSTELFN